MKRLLLSLALFVLFPVVARADAIYAISFNASGLGESILATTTFNAPGPTVVANVGGPVAYNTAALAYNGAGTLYGIANDGVGGWSIVPMTLGGGVGLGNSLPNDAVPQQVGWSGLAYNSGTFYSLAVDDNGAATLFSLNELGQVNQLGAVTGFGVAFPGGSGLAFLGGTLFATGNDANGFSYLFDIGLGGGPANLRFDLGFGFTGGLAADASTGKLVAVANDPFGSSTLYSIGLNGAVNAGTGLSGGVGYFGGVATVPVIPEPTTLALLGTGLAALKIRRKRTT